MTGGTLPGCGFLEVVEMKHLRVLKTVERTGVKAWLVGDSARMIEMGIDPKVMTLAVDARDLSSLSDRLDSATVDAKGTFPVLRGTVLGAPFRAYSLQGDTIADDLARRDLSIEAIALRSDGGVVDPFGGRRDIRNRVIRLTGDDVDLIDRDPLRIVRILRFAAELGMDVFWRTDMDVRDFLRGHSDRMNAIPAERWGREIIKGMKERPWRFIRLCDHYNLLPFFLKDLEDLKSVPDGRGRTLFSHVMATLSVIERRLPTHKIMQDEAFILAGLFSRIGTRSLDAGDEGERRKNEALTSSFLSQWNIPAETIRAAQAIIDGYRRFYESRTEEDLCRSVLEHGADAMAAGLDFAGCIARAEGLPHLETLSDNRWRLAQVLRRFKSVALQTGGASRFLGGDEVMSLLRLAPGRIIGALLDGLDVAVGTGRVTNRAQAEEWVVSHARSV